MTLRLLDLRELGVLDLRRVFISDRDLERNLCPELFTNITFWFASLHMPFSCANFVLIFSLVTESVDARACSLCLVLDCMTTRNDFDFDFDFDFEDDVRLD